MSTRRERLKIAARIPARWKAGRKQSKILFRRMIKDWVPDAIASRPKKGFTPPVLEWTKAGKYQWIDFFEVLDYRHG